MAEGITAISVSGYKSLIDECMIEVRPLTVLTGPNGSGKSSIMEPLLMMKQTLQSSYDPGPLQICGPNICLASADRFLPHQKDRSFTVMLQSNFGASTLEETFSFGNGKKESISRAVYTEMGEVMTLSENMTHEDLASFMPRWQEECREVLEEKLRRPVQWRVVRERCFLLPRAVSGLEGELQHFSFSLPSEPFDLALRRLIHVPALRGIGSQSSNAACSQPQPFPGRFDDYAGALVASWRASGDPRAEDLERWLCALGILGGLDGIAFSGTGAQQVFPVLAALLAASPGQMVYLEHPESHLSAGAKEALSNILAEAAGRGARIIVETHSGSIAGAAGEMVDTGKLASGMIQIYRFHRTGSGSAGACPVLP